MSYPQTYKALLNLGAPIAHLGARPVTHYPDRAHDRVHLDATCDDGGTCTPTTTRLDELATAPFALCNSCGDSDPLDPALQWLSLVRMMHLRFGRILTLTSRLGGTLTTWSHSPAAAMSFLDMRRELVKSADSARRWLDQDRAGQLDPELVPWVSQLVRDGLTVADAAAAAVRADLTLTAQLTGVALEGPLRWVLVERVPQLIWGRTPPLAEGVALAVFWQRLGDHACEVSERGTLLLPLPGALAAALTGDDTGDGYAHVDVGPVSPTDTPELPRLATRLMDQAGPEGPLAPVQDAVATARDILTAA